MIILWYNSWTLTINKEFSTIQQKYRIHKAENILFSYFFTTVFNARRQRDYGHTFLGKNVCPKNIMISQEFYKYKGLLISINSQIETT